METPLRALSSTDAVRALVYVSTTDVIFYLGVEGDRFRFLEVNPVFTRATGLSEEQVVGKFVDEVIPEPSLSIVLEKYREAVAERRTVRWTETTDYPAGTKYGEVSVTPIVGADGRCLSLVGTVHDVTEARRLDETVRLYADIARAVQIGLTVWNVEDPCDRSKITLAAYNAAAEAASGLDLAARMGQSLEDLLSAGAATPISDLVCDVARTGITRTLPEYRFVFASDRTRTFSLKAFPVSGGRVGLSIEDVSAEARARALNAAEQRVLEMVASGATLEQTLTALVLAVEEQAPPAIASVLLTSADGRRIHRGAAPSLPEEYTKSIDGALVGPKGGSCGTAVALRRSIFVTDVEVDPLWEDYRGLARRFGLRACWSTPIIASSGRVLGTFAIYYREPRSPVPAEIDTISRAVHVARIAIERHELDDQLRALSAHLEAAREEERTGIAREIHDQLGQALTVLKMDLAWISRRTASADGLAREKLLEKVKELSQATDEIIQQVRRISAELRPGVLDDIGLAAALSWRAQEFEKRTGIACVVESLVEDKAIARDVATTVFRVFEEALTNVVRHAEARRVDVLLEERDGTLVLEVSDDGVGIQREDIHDPHALGLLGIRERARRLRGTASFARVEPHGTQVTLRLPIGAGT